MSDEYIYQHERTVCNACKEVGVCKELCEIEYPRSNNMILCEKCWDKIPTCKYCETKLNDGQPLHRVEFHGVELDKCHNCWFKPSKETKEEENQEEQEWW